MYRSVFAHTDKQTLNTAISLFEQKNQEEELSLDEILETPEETPEEMMLRKEELNDYYKMLDQNLSKFEKQRDCCIQRNMFFSVKCSDRCIDLSLHKQISKR